MSWASVGNLGSLGVKAADQASLVLTTIAAIQVDNVGVIMIGVDNFQTTDGDEGAVTGVVDSAGNTWTKALEFTNGQGAAQAGITCSVWYVKAGIELPLGGTITASFSNPTSRDASCVRAWEFTIGAGNVVTVEATGTLANDGADPGSLDVTTPNAEFLRLRVTALEIDSGAAVTATVGWTNMVSTGSRTSGGVSDTNVKISSEYKISTETSSASNPTVDVADCASCYVAFKEAAPAGGARNYGAVIG